HLYINRNAPPLKQVHDVPALHPSLEVESWTLEVGRSMFLPLPVLRERAGVRVLNRKSQIANRKSPRPATTSPPSPHQQRHRPNRRPHRRLRHTRLRRGRRRSHIQPPPARLQIPSRRVQIVRCAEENVP